MRQGREKPGRPSQESHTPAQWVVVSPSKPAPALACKAQFPREPRCARKGSREEWPRCYGLWCRRLTPVEFHTDRGMGFLCRMHPNVFVNTHCCYCSSLFLLFFLFLSLFINIIMCIIYSNNNNVYYLLFLFFLFFLYTHTIVLVSIILF